MKELVLIEKNGIKNKILQIRNKNVMLDSDLAMLYEVTTKTLLQAIKRNKYRFPGDFMFQLTSQEFKNLRSQFVTSSWGGRRYAPYAFTEQGVAMLSSVLNSKRAILVNIQIVRAFVDLKKFALSYVKLKHKIEEMERKYDTRFRIVFETLKSLLEPPIPKNRIITGFRINNK